MIDEIVKELEDSLLRQAAIYVVVALLAGTVIGACLVLVWG